MSISTEFLNTLLYVKINNYTEFINKCHVGDTYVWKEIKSVITYIKDDIVLSQVVNQDGSKGRDMGVIITLGFDYGATIYKYIGPTAEDIQQKQDNINHLYAFLVEARLKPIIEEGCIAFIGEDFREGQEKDLAGRNQDMEFIYNSVF
jgi:hypothetical protein